MVVNPRAESCLKDFWILKTKKAIFLHFYFHTHHIALIFITTEVIEYMHIKSQYRTGDMLQWLR